MKNLDHGIYQHFKGKKYCVLNTALHHETGEILVIYQSMDNYKIYVRPLDNFLSSVDKEKYPDCMQKERFKLILSREKMKSIYDEFL